MSGTIAVDMDAGLLLLIEMGQIRLRLLWANFFCCQKSPKAHPQESCTEEVFSWSTASSAPPESSPMPACVYRPERPGGQHRRRYFPDPLAQPDRQEQHGNGKDDADDAVEARGGPLRLMIEMGNRSEWHFLNASRCLEAIRSPQSLEGRGLA